MGRSPLPSTTTPSRYLISAETLMEKLADVKIVDASFYLPAMNRNADEEFLAAHIPGAVRFDINDISTPHEDGLPHMLATAEIFSQKVGQLGISETDTVVVYDGIGLFSAPRVWLNFLEMGSKEVLILDGGFPAWQEAGLPVHSGPPSPDLKQYNAIKSDFAVNLAQMHAIIADEDIVVADARPKERFTGEAAEPRKGMKSGHIPSAISLPLNELTANNRLKSIEELTQIFREKGLFPETPIVASCGSGVTAAGIILAAKSINHQGSLELYDGSWSEWGGRQDTPIETGEDQNGVPVRVTFLQMNARPTKLPSRPHGLNLSLLAAHKMELSFYRFLYREVGDPWMWVNRRRMNDSELSAIIHADTTEISVLYLDGSPAGYFEIDRSDSYSPEIAFFGLMPRATGLGLGRWFMGAAIDAAWSRGEPNNIRVETCTGDHPAALSLYQKLGFSPVGTLEEKLFPLRPFEQAI